MIITRFELKRPCRSANIHSDKRCAISYLYCRSGWDLWFFSFGLNFLVRTRLLEACTLLDATASLKWDAGRLIRVIYVVPTKMFDAVRSYYHGNTKTFVPSGIGERTTNDIVRRKCMLAFFSYACFYSSSMLSRMLNAITAPLIRRYPAKNISRD